MVPEKDKGVTADTDDGFTAVVGGRDVKVISYFLRLLVSSPQIFFFLFSFAKSPDSRELDNWMQIASGAGR